MRFEERFKEFLNDPVFENDKPYVSVNMWRLERYFHLIGSSQEPLRILDIGMTPFPFFIKRCYPHYDVAICDISNHKDKCESLGIHFEQVDLTKEPIPFADDYFHIVIFAEVLEHLFCPPSHILKDIQRILQVGGTLIFSVPNLASLSHRIRLLAGRNPLPAPEIQMTPKPQGQYPHLREYIMSECVPLLEDCGFSIKSKQFLKPTLFYLATREAPVVKRIMNMTYSMMCLPVPSFRSEICIEASKSQ